MRRNVGFVKVVIAIPYDPVQDGFVFSKDQVEAFAQRLMRLNQSRHIEHVRFHMQPPSC
jgi:hypothetical protein